MPDVSVVIGVFYTVENLFYRIKLIRTKYHQALVALMQHDVLAYNLAQCTLVEEYGGKLFQVVERNVGGICPIEGELITAVRIVGKIAGVHAVGYDEQLDVIEQSVKGGLVIALYLVVCLFQLYTSAFQLNLDQRQAVDKYRHVITTFLSALNRNLIGNLKLVLTPVGTVKKLHPQAFAAFQFERKEVTQFLCLFKACATFKIDENLLKLRLCKLCASNLFQLLLVVFLQLLLEIGR